MIVINYYHVGMFKGIGHPQTQIDPNRSEQFGLDFELKLKRSKSLMYGLGWDAFQN